MLFYEDRSAPVAAEHFADIVRSWMAGRVLIVISSDTAPEDIVSLQLSILYADVSYSLMLDKRCVAAGAATERYFRNVTRPDS